MCNYGIRRPNAFMGYTRRWSEVNDCMGEWGVRLRQDDDSL